MNSGTKTTYLVKLPYLCLIAATMMLAMSMVLSSPYFSRKASSSDYPLRQLITPSQVWLEDSSTEVLEDLPVGDDQTPLSIPGTPRTYLDNWCFFEGLPVLYQSFGANPS